MEWVETTGKTVDEAVAAALDQLGVDRDEAEIEVLDEPKSGLFGRVRTEARVRARVRPAKPRAKEERRERRPAGKKAETAPAAASDAPAEEAPAEVAPASTPSRSGPRRDSAPVEALQAVPDDIREAGTAFLEGLLDAMGLDAEVTCGVVNANMIEFRVVGRDLGVLIGPKAQTLQAAQELLRTVVHYDTGSHSGRVLLDVAGYREKRRAALVAFTQRVASDVIATGQRRALEAMAPADRKVVHDAVNDIDGVRSLSEGEEPNRYVVIAPA